MYMSNLETPLAELRRTAFASLHPHCYVAFSGRKRASHGLVNFLLLVDAELAGTHVDEEEEAAARR